MSRRDDLERMLVANHFPSFSAEVEEMISRVVTRFGCSEDSDKVAEAVGGHCYLEDDLPGLALDENNKLTSESHDRVRAYLNTVFDYERQLKALPDKELRELFDEEERARQQNKVNNTSKSEIFEFYNDPNARADWNKWNCADALTPEEATALSFGKEPSVVSRKALIGHGGPRAPGIFPGAYRTRLNLVERAIKAGILQDPIRPAQFCKWAQEHHIALAEEMIGRANPSDLAAGQKPDQGSKDEATDSDVNSGNASSASDWRSKYEHEKAARANEHKKTLQILATALYAAYRFNPLTQLSETRRKLVDEIIKDAETLSIKLGRYVVEKRIDELGDALDPMEVSTFQDLPSNGSKKKV